MKEVLIIWNYFLAFNLEPYLHFFSLCDNRNT